MKIFEKIHGVCKGIIIVFLTILSLRVSAQKEIYTADQDVVLKLIRTAKVLIIFQKKPNQINEHTQNNIILSLVQQ